MNEKKPLLVFSGGMDSSYMLWKELEKGDVYTCYVDCAQSRDKVPLELAARKKIIAFFEELTGNKVISDTVVTIGGAFGIKMKTSYHTGSVTQDNNIPPDRTWSQAHQWMFGALYASDGTTKHSALMIGNIMGDSIALHIEDQKQAWTYLQRFSKNTVIPLEFPLAYTTKELILEALPLGMLKDVWVCEMPDYNEDQQWRTCNRCEACITLMKTIWGWEHRSGKNFQKYLEGQYENQQVLDKM